MLRGLRKASSNWLGKLVMAAVVGFLVISFAIWGIGDIFRGFGLSSLAKVGSTEISVEQFRRIYNEKLQELGRRLRRPITAEQARALGLERQIVGQMIAETALDERARQLRLNLSDAEVARQITNDPAFQGPNGSFDKFKFEQLIRNNGYTEATYAAQQRRSSLRRAIVDTVSGNVTAPRTAAEAVSRFENETRSAEFVVLDQSQAGGIPTPTPEELTKYFEDRKALFRAPEYRTVVLLTVAAADVARNIEVSEDEARRTYEQNKDRYGTPERRHVLQIVFPTPEEARAAADRIAGGLTFAALAAERGLKETDIDLGLVTKAGMIDRAVADAAFDTPEGQVSAPVAGRFGTALIQVVKIEPGHIKPFEEVAEEIKRQIAIDKTRPRLTDLYNKVEDERAAGKRLEEIAQALKLPGRTIEAIDRSGRDPQGESVAGLPPGVDALSSIFASDVGIENDALTIPGGGYVWYDVTAIKPSRDRKLEEIKDKVEARWRDDQIAERLSAKATEIVDKVKSGTPFAEAAGGLKVEGTFGLRRGRAMGALSSRAVDQIFRTPKDAAGTAEGKSAAERIVFRVTGISVPNLDPDGPEVKRYRDTIERALAEELLSQYLERLEADLGVSINQEALRRAIGSAGS